MHANVLLKARIFTRHGERQVGPWAQDAQFCAIEEVGVLGLQDQVIRLDRPASSGTSVSTLWGDIGLDRFGA